MEPTPPLSLADRWFPGPAGVGWGFLLYLLMAAATVTALSFAMAPISRLHLGQIWQMLIGELVLLTGAVVPAVIMSRIEGRPFGAYGLPRAAAFGRTFWMGTGWGIASLTVLMVTLRAVGAFYFGGLALHGFQILAYAAFWAVFFLIVAFFEEFLLRGYTQFTLSRGLGFWPAALILSTAFGAIHLNNKGEQIPGVLAAGFIGLFFCLTLRRTGNLWFAVGFHTSWNWGETYFYSVANSGLVAPGQLLNSTAQGPRWLSGGSVGPEGSALVFVLIAVLWVVFHKLYPGTKSA
jgi:membrane protease YdiL (CAAX protease family)